MRIERGALAVSSLFFFTLIFTVALALTLGACSDYEDKPADAGAADLFPRTDTWWYSDLPVYADLAPLLEGGTTDGSSKAKAQVLPLTDVPGNTCKDAWQSTKTKGPSATCTAYLSYVQLGVGSGAEPDKYGCMHNTKTGAIDAMLFEKSCDDTKLIGLTCGAVCAGKGVTVGSVQVSGTSCYKGWKDSGKNLGAGKSCKAFIGQVRLGGGSGPEPDTYGCRYNSTTGSLEAYLYEKGCDDKAKISLRCDWICWDSGAASSGTTSLDGKKCKSGWQATGTGIGANKTCAAGIELMQLGVGSGPEPDRYGCRYNSTVGDVEAQLFEKSCDDKSIKIDCGYVCFK